LEKIDGEIDRMLHSRRESISEYNPLETPMRGTNSKVEFSNKAILDSQLSSAREPPIEEKKEVKQPLPTVSKKEIQEVKVEPG